MCNTNSNICSTASIENMKRSACNCDYGSYATPHEALGGYLGGKAGSFLGAAAARGVGKIFGWGDYEIKTNSLIGGGGLNSSLQIIPKGDGTTRIMYREYLGDVFTSSVAGAFLARSFPINPGQIDTFPWLAPIAMQYDQWTPMGIVFEFRSTSSDYTATQALGSVIMATEYDALDAVFPNKQEMLNSAYSQEAKPTDRMLHGVECDPGQNPQRIFYTRGSKHNVDYPTLPAGSSIRDYDLGNFVVATQGGTTASLNLGSLYVYYDIIFRKEQMYNGIPDKGPLNYYAQMGGTINGANPLGTALLGMTGGNLAPVKNAVAGQSLVFPAATVGSAWRVIATYAGGSVALTAPLITLTEMTVNPLTFNGSTTWQAPNNGVASTAMILIINVLQTGPSAQMHFGVAGTLPSALTQARLFVTQISSTWDTVYA